MRKRPLKKMLMTKETYMMSNKNMTIQRPRGMWFSPSLCIVVAAMLFAACSSESGPAEEFGDSDVRVNLAMTVSTLRQNGNVTRMSYETAQIGENYRDIQDICCIPYTVQGPITENDVPTLGLIQSVPYITGNYYFHGGTYNLEPRTASFLCYARAVPSGDKAVDGSIIPAAYATERMLTSKITFSPDPIYELEASVVPSGATALATYLNLIANTKAGEKYWRDVTAAEDANLNMLFQYFTGEGELMAGSSANVKALVNELKKGINKQPDSDMKTAILNTIGDVDANVVANYPGSLGLPDGAAVLKWNGSNFEPQTQTTTIADINRIDRFVYPAELYYYANSQIHTSNKEVTASQYEGKTWDDVLNMYERKNAAVSSNTQAAVIINPLHYGVGCLEANVRTLHNTLQDAMDKEIPVANSFHLTGIIISGQYQQQFNFKPKEDDLTEYIIYDHNLPDITLSTAASTPFYTLTFQSKENDTPVRVVLEFENKSGITFTGHNGVVYPDTKFYLVGELVRPATQTQDYMKRIFTQDYKTKVDLRVKSLAKAYNVMPDLMNARLELGVELDTDWIRATETGVVLR